MSNCTVTGQRIRELRLKKGWTQNELSARMNASHATRAFEWETGKRTPSLTSAAKLARALGVKLDDLVSGVEL